MWLVYSVKDPSLAPHWALGLALGPDDLRISSPPTRTSKGRRGELDLETDTLNMVWEGLYGNQYRRLSDQALGSDTHQREFATLQGTGSCVEEKVSAVLGTAVLQNSYFSGGTGSKV